MTKKPLFLCILDGWGVREEKEYNAIANANTPNWDRILEKYPNSTLSASGLDVGLPEGQMGNSEVGHMTIGSGRVILQDLPKINKAIREKTLIENTELKNFINGLKTNGGDCHLLGLLSCGGVHAHQDHIFALANIIAGQGIKVLIHMISDGRDTSPKIAIESLKEFSAKIDELEEGIKENIQIATISGRFYAMDRDNRWERIEQPYNAITLAEGENFDNPISAIEASYAKNETDEFVKPVTIGDYKGAKNNDGLLIANFRADRAREIIRALCEKDFAEFERKKIINFEHKLGMVEYSTGITEYMPAIFPAESPKNILGEVISNAGLTQLRSAETEKYAHVTFFFSGGREREFSGEKRILINSPQVETYDLQPEMSAKALTETLVESIKSGEFDVIIANFANPDMVGHTGIMEAAISAAQTIDKSLGKLESAILEMGGTMLITADHGNLEDMFDEKSGQALTSHTLNPVPFVLIGTENLELKDGRLSDIAPTMLEILKIDKPEEMDGNSLLKC